MPTRADYEEITAVPRVALRLPLALEPPDGFQPERLETWPAVDGRLEYVRGRLLYMPPCGDEQQDTAVDLLRVLGNWQDAHREFAVGGNEAGVLLGGEIRAADGAVWRRRALGAYTGGLRRVAPLLAVEIAGRDESVEALGEKAAWYLAQGVQVVWILDPRARTVRVVTRSGSRDVACGERLPRHRALPGLAPAVDDLFRQVSSGDPT